MTQLGSKKSRKGCRRCKQRRVKCDEQAPCNNCRRRHEDCSLLYDTPSSSSGAAADSNIPSNTEDWLEDLELMHHYGTNVISIGSRARVLEIWRDYIPQQALKHPFLMHGLLALSALHLAYVYPHASARYLQLCDKHQTIALETYRGILSAEEIEPEFADALFALSAVLCISSMAKSSAVCENGIMDMEAVTQLFALTRGTRDVIDVTDPHVRQGPLFALLDITPRPENTSVLLPTPISAHFTSLRHLLATTPTLSPQAHTDCSLALHELEEIYKNIVWFAPLEDIQTDHLFRWKVRVPAGYLRLVEEREPAALVLLAYYAAAVTAIKGAWFTRRWACCVLRGVSLCLGEGMGEWISWPLRQVQERMGELGVRTGGSEAGSPEEVLGGV